VVAAAGVPVVEKLDLQFQGLVFLTLIVKHNPTWLSAQPQLVQQVLNIWVSEAFLQRHNRMVSTVTIVRPYMLLSLAFFSFNS
jgi:hypothetical protein